MTENYVLMGITEFFESRKSKGRDGIQKVEYYSGTGCFVTLTETGKEGRVFITCDDTIDVEVCTVQFLQLRNLAEIERLRDFLKLIGVKVPQVLPSPRICPGDTLDRLEVWLQKRSSKGRDKIKRVWMSRGKDKELLVYAWKNERISFRTTDQTTIEMRSNIKLQFGVPEVEFKLMVEFFEGFYGCEFDG